MEEAEASSKPWFVVGRVVVGETRKPSTDGRSLAMRVVTYAAQTVQNCEKACKSKLSPILPYFDENDVLTRGGHSPTGNCDRDIIIYGFFFSYCEVDTLRIRIRRRK